MDSFFELPLFDSPDEPQSKSKKKLDCFTCGLFRSCRCPEMKVSGKGNKRILIVLESPGKADDQKGEYLQANSGKFLKETFQEFDFEMDDFWVTSALLCKPIGGIKDLQVKCCKRKLQQAIDELKPALIILFGEASFKSVIGEKIHKYLSGHKFLSFVGQCIPDQKLKTFIGIMRNPLFVLDSEEKGVDRNGNIIDPSVRLLWKRDLKSILDYHSKSFYSHNYVSDVMTTLKKEQAIAWIEDALKKGVKVIAEDYETTGLKPHREGHSIKTISFSDGVFAYAFPNFEDDEFRLKWKQLQKSNLMVVAHNLKFESMWTQSSLGYQIIGEYYDTMIAAHCYNNQMRTGLKFWSYLVFGILGYDEHIEKFIKTPKEGENENSSNSFNKIDDADIDDLLLYNGLDSLLCFKLMEYFERKLEPFQKKSLSFLTEGSKYLLDIQQNGIRIDTQLLSKTKTEIEGRLKQLDEKVQQSDEVSKWEQAKKFN